MTITVRLDEKLDKRLSQLSKKTHKTKSFYIKEALKNYLEDREDYLLALAAFEKKEPTTNIKDLRKELGLED